MCSPNYHLRSSWLGWAWIDTVGSHHRVVYRRNLRTVTDFSWQYHRSLRGFSGAGLHVRFFRQLCEDLPHFVLFRTLFTHGFACGWQYSPRQNLLFLRLWSLRLLHSPPVFFCRCHVLRRVRFGVSLRNRPTRPPSTELLLVTFLQVFYLHFILHQ